MGFSQVERNPLANLMHVNEAKRKVLHRYRLGGEWAEAMPGKKDLGALLDE